MDRQVRSRKEAQSFQPNWEPTDKEEQELAQMFKDGTLARAVARPKKNKTMSAMDTIKIPITIRLDQLTISVLKDRAKDEGLRYQSLINSVLLKYITGRLVERKK